MIIVTTRLRLFFFFLISTTDIILRRRNHHVLFCQGLVTNQPTRHVVHDLDDDVSLSTRRRFVTASTFFSAIPTVAMVNNPDPVWAFANKISTKYDDRPKTRGPKPNDLGVSTRTTTMDGFDDYGYVGLKGCGVAPNCFSSSVTEAEDPEHYIPPWVSTSSEVEASFMELKKAVEAYQPGQNGVDGGGFQIQTFDPKKGYFYIQFEALKNGYIDDVEFAVVDPVPTDGTPLIVQVRSSSRIGYLDFGVNAKRLNYLAASMRSKGWISPGVDWKTHPLYVSENQL